MVAIIHSQTKRATKFIKEALLALLMSLLVNFLLRLFSRTQFSFFSFLLPALITHF